MTQAAIVKTMVGGGWGSAKGIHAHNAKNKTNGMGRKLRYIEESIARVENGPVGWSEHVREQTFTHVRTDTWEFDIKSMKRNNPRIDLGGITKLKGFFLSPKGLRQEQNTMPTQQKEGKSVNLAVSFFFVIV